MRRLDLYVADAGCVVLGWVLVLLHSAGFHTVYTVAAVIGLIVIICYVLWLRRLVNTNLVVRATNRATTVTILSAISCIALAIFVYWARTNQYEKPLLYYLLMASAIGLLFWTIASGSKNYKTVVALACCIGLCHIWTETLLFPGLIGIDPWLHQWIVLHDNTKLSFNSIGMYPSLWHLYLRRVLEWTGLEYRVVALASVGSVQIIGNSILAFVIGRKLSNSARIGTVAALVLSFANWNITFGEWIIPSGIGATFAMLTLYLVLKSRCSANKPLYMACIACVLAVSALVHTLAIAWSIGVVLAYLLIETVYCAASRKWTSTFARGLTAAVLVALAVIWLYNTPSGGATLSTLLNSSPYAAFGTGSSPTDIPTNELVYNCLVSGAFWETLLNSIGMLLYIGVALTGTLALLRRDKQTITYAVICITILGIGFFPTLLGLPFLDDRWRYFAMILLAIPLGLTLVSVGETSKKTAIVTAVLVTALAFLNTIGWWSNLNQRAISPNQIVRYALTQGEMDGLAIADRLEPKILGVDPYYLSFVMSTDDWHGSTTKVPVYLDRNLLDADFRNCKADVILLRKAVYTEPFAFGSGEIHRLKYNPVELAKRQGYTEVWNNGEIACLVRR